MTTYHHGGFLASFLRETDWFVPRVAATLGKAMASWFNQSLPAPAVEAKSNGHQWTMVLHRGRSLLKPPAPAID